MSLGLFDGTDLVFAEDSAKEARSPNIVLILADDLGYSDLGCYGGEIPTPNLDRLAGDGVRFTQFYNCAVCVTTRASLVTGLYPRQGGRGLLRPSMPTIAEVLRSAGYQTSLSGKWHLGNSPDKRPTARGFDEYYGIADGACNYFDPSQPDPEFYNGGHQRTFLHNNEPVTEFAPDFYTTDAFADHAASMIERFSATGRPFFVHVCFNAPHFPLHAPAADVARHAGKYDDGYFRLRETRFRRQQKLGLVDADWRLPPADTPTGSARYDYEIEPWESVDRVRETRRMEVYAAMVERLDAGVGRILAALERHDRAQNTLVLFLSDNGGCASLPTDHSGWRAYNTKLPGDRDTYDFCGPGWGWAQSTPFRRYKTWTYEGGIATPLIVRWPGVVAPNSISHEVGHVMDLLPTCLELAAASLPERFDPASTIPFDGRSLVPVFRDGSRQGHDFLCWYLYGNRAVRQGRWKLDWDRANRVWELYDLEADRTETHNLAAEQPERVAALDAIWKDWARRTELEYEDE